MLSLFVLSIQLPLKHWWETDVLKSRDLWFCHNWMLLRQKLFLLSIIRTASMTGVTCKENYWANRWELGPKSSLPVPQRTGPKSRGQCRSDPFLVLHWPLPYPGCRRCSPSNYHFLFYTVDSCRPCLQSWQLWALQWWGLGSSESTTQTTFRLLKLQAYSQMRTCNYPLVIYKYLS